MTEAREASHPRSALSVCTRSQTPPLGVTGAFGFVGEQNWLRNTNMSAGRVERTERRALVQAHLHKVHQGFS